MVGFLELHIIIFEGFEQIITTYVEQSKLYCDREGAASMRIVRIESLRSSMLVGELLLIGATS
jgi:hypothetical protein